MRDFHGLDGVEHSFKRNNDQLFSLSSNPLNRGDTENAIEHSRIDERIGDNNPNATAQLAEIYEKASSTEELPD